MKFLCKAIIFLLSFLLAFQKALTNPFQKPQCKNNEECKIDEQCDDGKCAKILSNNFINEKNCSKSSDCPPTYVCSNTYICSEVKTTADVMKKQTCQGVFKSRCFSDSSCACEEDKMVCEDGECVVQKEKRETFPCEQHIDCSFGFLCSNNTCIENQSWEFLLQILEIQPKEKNTKNSNGHDDDNAVRR